jgi:predicted transcriptional regulator
LARVSIYVSDELKARMDEVGEQTNWSEIARPAFLSAVASNEHRKGQSMTTAVERLRASKEEHLSEMKNVAKEAGRQWASDNAEYKDLVRLAKIDPQVWVTYDVVKDTLDPEKVLSHEEFVSYLGLEEDDLGVDVDEFVADFVKAAVAFYHEIADQL